MRRFKKLTAVFILVLCISMIFGTTTAFASNNIGQSQNNHKFEVTSFFIQYIDGYFKSHEIYNVLDNNGNEIGESFYRENLNNYKNSNYYKIRENISNNVSKIIKTVDIIDANNSKRMVRGVNKTVSQQFMEVIKAPRNGIFSGREEEFYYTIYGRYVFDRATSKITSCSPASFNVDYTTFGQWWNYELKNTYTNSKIDTDKYAVRFTVGFNIESTLVLPLGDLPLGIKYNFGHHSSTLIGYPSDY